MAGGGELTEIKFSTFIKEENSAYTGCGWPSENSVQEDSQSNGLLMTENLIKQEPGQFVGLNNPEPDGDYKVHSFLGNDGVEQHEIDWFTCLVCNEHFLSTEELSIHALEHIKSKPEEDVPKVPTNHKIRQTQLTGLTRQKLLQDYVHIAVELDGETTYTCKLCPDKVFGQLASIRNHMKIHENRTYKERSCHVCHKTFFLREALLAHLKVHNEKLKYKCEICEASFANLNSLNDHKHGHSTKKPYACSTCNKAFRTLGQLTDHKKIHSSDALLPCDKCPRKFASYKALSNHYSTHNDERTTSSGTTDQAVHADEKPFKCQMCTYATTQSGYLRRHMRTHTGERPHKCSYCDKAFAERKRLVSHTRSHTGERPFKCTYCDASYARNDNLKYHLRTHTGERPFECDQCGKRFIQRAALTGHQKIHTDEKPYSCPHCAMNFRHSGTLVTHLLIHTNERPFKCDFCEKGFTQKALLKRHVTREHGDEDVTMKMGIELIL